jgi:predicted alpha/beta-hydrolase family hydrolase
VELLHNTEVSPAVRGYLHRPKTGGGDAIVLTHGAGGNANAPLLVALCDAFAAHGCTALRCDLPFRQQRPMGPPRSSGEIDRDGLRRAVEVMRALACGRVFLGGISYGGRMASMAAAEDAKFCDGLLLLSYPLHPPGKPQQLRIAHLAKIAVPALFVSGDKDPFGSPEELSSALKKTPSKPALLTVPGVGHDLGFGKRARKKMEDLPQQILQTFLQNIS